MSPDGTLLAGRQQRPTSSTPLGYAVVLDARTLASQRVINSTSGVTALAFDDTGQSMLIGTDDGIDVWEPLGERLAQLLGHTSTVRGVCGQRRHGLVRVARRHRHQWDVAASAGAFVRRDTSTPASPQLVDPDSCSRRPATLPTASPIALPPPPARHRGDRRAARDLDRLRSRPRPNLLPRRHARRHRERAERRRGRRMGDRRPPPRVNRPPRRYRRLRRVPAGRPELASGWPTTRGCR